MLCGVGGSKNRSADYQIGRPVLELITFYRARMPEGFSCVSALLIAPALSTN